jgi:ankyrin repeat protein
MATFLIENGADINFKDGMERTPLHLSCAFGSFGVVKAMVQAPNADLNARDSKGRTPLHWCYRYGG